MSKHFDPQDLDYRLPYLNRATAESLLNDKMHDDDTEANAWQELSDHNPYLRDYITITANRAEPNDLEARRKLIKAMLGPLSALSSAITIQKLDSMWGVSFASPSSEPLAQPQEAAPTYIEPNKAA